MSDIGTDLEEAVMDWVFEEASMPSPPTNLYVGLHTGPPGNDGTDNEVDASDYDRFETTPGEWDRLAGSGPSEAENNTDIEFPEAASDWGVITHVSLWTTEDNSGMCLYQTQLDSSISVELGDIFLILAGFGTWGLD